MWPFGRAGRTGRLPVGRRGEDLAAAHLKRCGMKILARNYRCPAGEADIIALDDSAKGPPDAETIVFVEVKTRSSDKHTDPHSAVNADKQRRIRKVASYYLAARDAARRHDARFDVVSIVLRDGRPPRIEHIPGAF